jgi:TolA-binding protein
MTCPSDVELARALTVGPEPAGHLATCAACRERWDATRAVIELARELPVAVPPATRREEVRTAVLAAAASAPDRPARRAWLAPIVVGAAAAGVVGYVALARPSAEPNAHRSHGTVHPHAGAHYVASTVGPDEVIRLTEGVIDVEVEPLLPGERFRVVIGDAELEVRGTAFTVSAVDERLVDVAVAHGRVDVRPRAGAPATLGNGQSWRGSVANAAAPGSAIAARAPASPNAAAPLSPDVPSGPPATPAKQVPRAASGTASQHASSSASRSRVEHGPSTASDHGSQHGAAHAPEGGPPGLSEIRASRSEPEASAVSARPLEERAYDQAWGALRANDFARAASGFARVLLLLTPDSALVEDASFWRAVALARGQRTVEAVSAFRDFVDGFSTSARTGEASAMLGWLLIDERAYDEAARRFRLAARDASPAVRKSAQSGLDALARRRP